CHRLVERYCRPRDFEPLALKRLSQDRDGPCRHSPPLFQFRSTTKDDPALVEKSSHELFKIVHEPPCSIGGGSRSEAVVPGGGKVCFQDNRIQSGRGSARGLFHSPRERDSFRSPTASATRSYPPLRTGGWGGRGMTLRRGLPRDSPHC